MVSLSSVQRRFEIECQVIEGGTGVVHGVLAEAPQAQAPSYVFVAPRMILRVRKPSALRSGMVVRTPEGSVYIVGDNGPSEVSQGTLWESYRLFEATGQYNWQRRTKTVDPVTRLPQEGPLQELGLVWAALEPEDRMAVDLKLRVNIEQSRFIAAKPILPDDILNGQPVIRSDSQLGILIGVIS
jgi:hypothetical protein